MEKNIMFERDLLYPSENIYEPGIIHIEILKPNTKGSMPVVVESKSSHSPLKNIGSIIQVMQSDLFDRINIDVKRNISLYIKINDTLKEAGFNGKYVGIGFDGDNINFKNIDEIEA